MAELRGLVCTATGWTSKQFDETPIPVIYEMLEYWADNPPTHVIQAAKAGVKKKKRKLKDAPMPKPIKKDELKPVNAAEEAQLPEWVRQARNTMREEAK